MLERESTKNAHKYEMMVEKRQKIKLFQIIQRYFAILGISSNYSKQNDMLNRNVLKASVFYGLNSTFNTIFLLVEASNFREYIDSIIATTSVFGILFCFMIVFSEMSKLFEFIENCERVTNERK